MFFSFSQPNGQRTWTKGNIVVPIGKRISRRTTWALVIWRDWDAPSPEFLLLKWNEKRERERKKNRKDFCVLFRNRRWYLGRLRTVSKRAATVSLGQDKRSKEQNQIIRNGNVKLYTVFQFPFIIWKVHWIHQPRSRPAFQSRQKRWLGEYKRQGK